jgi:Homeodomain-like domain
MWDAADSDLPFGILALLKKNHGETTRVQLAESDEEIVKHEHAGRPTKFKPEYVRLAKFMAQRGATQDEIADCFGVTTRTLQNWLVAYPELQSASGRSRIHVRCYSSHSTRSLTIRTSFIPRKH